MNNILSYHGNNKIYVSGLSLFSAQILIVIKVSQEINFHQLEVYSRTLKTPHLFYCTLLSKYMIYQQKYF